MTMKMLRPICITAYAPPTMSPHRPNAVGSAADITSDTPARANRSSRTGIRSGSSQLVTHAVYAQASHTMPSSRAVCRAPATVGRCSRWCDNWVTANT